MEDLGDYEFGEDDAIAEAIIFAAVAGGLRYWAPRKSRAEGRLMLHEADGFSAAATALLNDWTARQAEQVVGRSAHLSRPDRPDTSSIP